MPFKADRKNEDILFFLQREGWWQKKSYFEELINEGKLKVNNRKIKPTYKPKKGDEIEFESYRFVVSQ